MLHKSNFMEIKCDGFILRPLVMSDAAALTKYANNRNISAYLRDSFPFPYSEKDAQWFISQQSEKEKGGLRLGIEINGEIGGIVGLYPQQDVYRVSIELGYWLGEPFWGKGIMVKAVNAVVALAFENNKELSRIYAQVYERNHASVRVLEKAGFTREGIMRKAIIKNGVIMDAGLYSLIRDENKK